MSKHDTKQPINSANQLDDVLTLANYFQNSDMTFFEVKTDALNVCFKREQQLAATPITMTQAVYQVQTPTVKADVIKSDETVIKAPLVGTYYSSNAPGAKPFVNVGDTVKKGDVIAIIEAMKVMNEIKAPTSGVVKSILVTNEAAVSFDETLMIMS